MEVKILKTNEYEKHIIYISKFIRYNNDNRNCRIAIYRFDDKPEIIELDNQEFSNLQDSLNEIF